MATETIADNHKFCHGCPECVEPWKALCPNCKQIVQINDDDAFHAHPGAADSGYSVCPHSGQLATDAAVDAVDEITPIPDGWSCGKKIELDMPIGDGFTNHAPQCDGACVPVRLISHNGTPVLVELI